MTTARWYLLMASTAGLLAVPAAADIGSQTEPATQADATTRPPWELVRTLNTLQDQTGAGNTAAHNGQRSLIASIGVDLAKAPDTAWQDAKNARALISFVLSGGAPDLLKRLMDKKVELAGIEPDLAAGVIAFAERRNEEARLHLVKVDARKLQPSLAAHVALVQGIVLADREPEKAIKSLQFARLLIPGSMVEQGALRREILLTAKTGRWHEAEALAAQYLRRFGQSVYAQTFYRELADQLARAPDTRDDEQFARLVTLFNMIGEQDRRRTYLFLAERAVVAGRIKMARFAAARASEMYEAGSNERARLEVYGAAADVATAKSLEGIKALHDLDRGKLGVRDTLLANAAIEVGDDVRREPLAPNDVLKAAAGSPEGHAASESPPAVIEQARKSIEKVDDLLKAAK